MKMDVFRLSWRKVWIVVVSWFVVVLLHNAVSALLETEEMVFFIVAIFVYPAYVLVALIYSVYRWARRR